MKANLSNIVIIVVLSICISFTYGSSVVLYDSDGVVKVNGKRIFVYGGYRDPSDDWRKFDGVREAGFNLTHDYYFETKLKKGYSENDVNELIKEAREYLDLAEKAGVGVFYGIPRQSLWGKDTETISRIVDALKDKSALWFWYLCDEPTNQVKDNARKNHNGRSLEDVKKSYDVIKKVDPNHPVVIVDGGHRLKDSVEAGLYCDTLWVDRYLIPYSTLGIGRNIELVRSLYPDKPIWGVPETGDRFSWLREARTKKKNQNLYPSTRTLTINDQTAFIKPKAIRSQAHACISAGADGVVYWWGPKHLHDFRKDTPELWKAQVNLGKELRGLSEILLSKEPVPDINIVYDKWGMYLRMDHLYDKELEKDQYPQPIPVMVWKRMYQGSLYMGFVCDYVPIQKITLNLPFEYKRAVQLQLLEQKTIISRNAKGGPQINTKDSEVAIWDVQKNMKSFSFIMQDCDTIVWRFDPVITETKKNKNVD
ncbi:MAG: hypothetical protein A2Y10_05660 [Planctomycetes bacterium GWF2_41_51]|nr:MAG: hypothetical protein A2Y10_05660 [Planctomycetes bacterium GWF2_41_51]